MTSDLRHPVQVVARRTGLSPHVLRVWEKRYATIKPVRSGGNQRLYTEADVERLALLKRVTDAGHNIGRVSHLAIEQLAALPGNTAVLPSRPARRALRPAAPQTGPELLTAAYQAVEQMDAAGLERTLDQGSLVLGQIGLLGEVIAPLTERIGEAWRVGRLKVAHEHIASAVIRTYLGHVARPHALHGSAPVLLATTPAGQLHELGAALVAAAATSHGWRVTYAGAALPAEEIAATAIHQQARAVALSIVHPADDPALPAELKRLRRLLPEPVALILGGRAAAAYAKVIAAIGARRADSLAELTDVLEQLRQGEN